MSECAVGKCFCGDFTTSQGIPQVRLSLKEEDNQQPKSSTNPKDIAGKQKPQLALIPPAAELLISAVLENGAGKYGPWNWRRDAVEMAGYISAIKRHTNAIAAGEDTDKESGLPHLAHIAATCCILIDAAQFDKIIDNRPTGEDFVFHESR